MYFSEAAMWRSTRERMETDDKYVKIERKDISAVVFFETLETGRVVLMAFAGKRSKPDVHVLYETQGEATKDADEFFKRIEYAINYKTHRANEALVRRSYLKGDYKVGDLFVSSWGYDQTQVDFYQIVEKNGYRVTLRKIAAEQVPGSAGNQHDQARAVRDAFVGEPFTRMITQYGIRRDSWRHLSKTDENEGHHRSWWR